MIDRNLSGHGSGAKGDLSPESIRAELGKVLASRAFRQAGRSSRLLRCAVESALDGQGERLKEYSLGVDVFGRGEDFDPRIDPVVRVEAHRLRSRLKAYYQSEGARDAVRIEFPRGGYEPAFRPAPPRLRSWALSRRVAWTVSAGLVAAAVFGGIVWLGRSAGIRMSAPQAPYAASVAVLPFSDVSPKQDQEYFCDGMTDELINALSKVEGLRVVSRTSVFQFRGKASDIRRIGQQLNVGAVLEGSVRMADGKLRVAARLVNVADGYHLWSGNYDREASDIFAIQEEIATAIAGALQVRLARGGAFLTTRGPATLQVYNLYLQGRFHWNRRTDSGLLKSLEYYQQAIAEDTEWAVVHAAVADSYAMLASYGVLPPREAMPKARNAAERALGLDDTLGQAHAALGFVRSFYDWDWTGAEQAYRRSIELSPGYATALQWYSGFLRAMGRMDEALALAMRAQELDPLSVAIGRDTGRIFHSSRQYDRAIEHYRKVLELDPNFPSAHAHLGMAYKEKRMLAEALEAFQTAKRLPGSNPFVIAALGYCYGISGNQVEAGRLLRELEDLTVARYVSPISRVLIYLGLSEHDRAFEWLERARQEHDPWLVWLAVDPVFDPLRPDARFTNLLKSLHLPQIH